MPILLAAAVSAAPAALAWRLRALSPSGAVAALVVGTLILAATGWPGAAILGVYFATSTGISRIVTDLRAEDDDQARTETRTARQVIANGGPAALGALVEWHTPGLGLWLVAVGLAAAGADTWATAFGGLSPRPPRDLLRLRVVPRGTSGGVTWFGTTGSLMGAATIGLTAMSVGAGPRSFLAAALIGAGATVLDSALGSGLQARFYCPACDRPTERGRHCGTTPRLVSGVAWFDNDAVNLVSTAAAVATGFLAW
ncbi:MAG: DUF92 domain-containing protein [Gemmatimonadales bacterium]